jgi:hypothetical protein
MTKPSDVQSVAPWRDELSYSLLYVAALIAAITFAAASRAVTDAPPELRAPEIWRMWGQLLFSGMCLVLALSPRSYAGIWELALGYSAGIAVVLTTATPSGGFEILGAVLSAAAVAISYVVARGYLAWKRPTDGTRTSQLSISGSFTDAAPRRSGSWAA